MTYYNAMPQVGSGAGVVLYAGVRLSFLLSIISIFPMQMWPLRQALCKLVLGRELHGALTEPGPTAGPSSLVSVVRCA